MEIRNIYRYGHLKERTGIHIVAGAVRLETLNLSDSETAARWNTRIRWSDFILPFNEFEVAYYNFSQIRTKYPFVVIFASQIQSSPDNPTQIPLEIFERYPNTRVQTHFSLMQDGDFHVFEDIKAYLFDIGKNDIVDFADAMIDSYDPNILVQVLLLFSDEPKELRILKEIIEHTSNASELRSRMLDCFQVFFHFTEDYDLVMATRDKMLIKAFLKNPRFRR
jgi:hypothetical protein